MGIEMIAIPITKYCRDALDKKEHAVFGISPFNSYFSEAQITNIAHWGYLNFKSIHLFMPDIPSAYTLEALGYSPQKAEKKARRQANYLRNKMIRALENIGISETQTVEIILDWKKLETNPYYQSVYKKCINLFETDTEFHRGCLESSKWVLHKRVDNGEVIPEATLNIAVKYFLAEMPLFIDSVGILNKKASVFCYHQCPEFLRTLYEKRYQNLVKPYQGFIQLQPIQ